MYSVNKCNKLSRFNRNGFFVNSLFSHKLFPLLDLEYIKLDCMATYPNYKQKMTTAIFPITQRCPDSIVALGIILNKAKKERLNTIKITYNDSIYYIFHRKEYVEEAKLYAYLIMNFTNAKTNKEKVISSYTGMLLRNENEGAIRGYYIHRYLYGRGLIPLPTNVQADKGWPSA